MTSAYHNQFPGDVASLQLPGDFTDATIHVASAAAEVSKASVEYAVFKDDSSQFALFSEAVTASMHTVVDHVESLDAPDPQGEEQHTKTQELRSAIDAFRQKIDDQESVVKTCEANLASTRTLLPPIWTSLSTLQTTGRNLTKEYQTLKELITPLVDELNHPEKPPTLLDIPCPCATHAGYTDPETGAVVSSAEHLDELGKSLKKSEDEFQAIKQVDDEVQFNSTAEQIIFGYTKTPEDGQHTKKPGYVQRLEDARTARLRSERQREAAEQRMIGLQRTLFILSEAAQKKLKAELKEIADQRAAKEAELAGLKQSTDETLTKLEAAQTEYSAAVKALKLVEGKIESYETELAAAREQLSALTEIHKPDATQPDTESSAAGSDPDKAQSSTPNPRRLRAVPDIAADEAGTEASQTATNRYKKVAKVTFVDGLQE